MVDLKILKNPITIGVIMFLITFAYLYWDNSRKSIKNSNIKKRYEFVTPALVGVFSWFITANYFDNNINSSLPINNNINNNNLNLNNDLNMDNQIDNINVSPNNYKIVAQDGINIPNNIDTKMPDMFIELDNFS